MSDQATQSSTEPFDVESAIRAKLAQRCTQSEIADIYQRGIVNCCEAANWPLVNEMIMARWSLAGLKRVKKMANDLDRWTSEEIHHFMYRQ